METKAARYIQRGDDVRIAGGTTVYLRGEPDYVLKGPQTFCVRRVDQQPSCTSVRLWVQPNRYVSVQADVSILVVD